MGLSVRCPCYCSSWRINWSRTNYTPISRGAVRLAQFTSHYKITANNLNKIFNLLCVGKINCEGLGQLLKIVTSCYEPGLIKLISGLAHTHALIIMKGNEIFLWSVFTYGYTLANIILFKMDNINQ